jgi:hypothetical protein
MSIRFRSARPAVAQSVAVVVVLVAVFAAQVGVADAKTVSPNVWATQFCRAVHTWGTNVDDVTSKITAATSNITGVASGQALIVQLIGTIEQETGQTAAAIRAAGIPNVPNGKKLSATFVNAFTNGAQQLAQVEAQAKQLSTTDANAFAAGIGPVLTKLQIDPITPSFNRAAKLDTSKKLDAALSANTACKSLFNSNTGTTAADCTSSAQELNVAEEAYFATNSKYATQDDLVTAGMLHSKDPNYSITVSADGQSYQLVPTSTCPTPTS